MSRSDAPTGANHQAKQAGGDDEFRGRAEAWMKEITAQVARLAGRAEDEDKNRAGLDARLADLDGRLRSLLTLTEMVSLEHNPFVGRANPGAPNGNTASATATAAAPAGASTAPPAAQGPDAPAPAAPTSAFKYHPNDAAMADGPDDEGMGDAVPAEAAGKPDAPHYTDPAEAATRRPTAAATPATLDAAARPTYIPPHPASHFATADGPLAERLRLVDCAELVAGHVAPPELGAFLGFYVEAHWLTAIEAGLIRNLALQLANAQDRGDAGPRPGLAEMHRRMLHLLHGAETARPEARPARPARIPALAPSQGPVAHPAPDSEAPEHLPITASWARGL